MGDMVSPVVRWWRGLARSGHGRADAGDVTAGQQAVPVEPLEHELAEVVETRLLEQWQSQPSRVVAGQRLGVVVEVDEQRLVEAGLDEAVGVAVEAGFERLVRPGSGARSRPASRLRSGSPSRPSRPGRWRRRRSRRCSAPPSTAGCARRSARSSARHPDLVNVRRTPRRRGAARQRRDRTATSRPS